MDDDPDFRAGQRMADEAKRQLERPSPEVVPGPPPTPSVRRSPLPQLNTPAKKWVAVASGLVTVLGTLTVTVVKAAKQLDPSDRLEELRQQMADQAERQQKLEALWRQHLRSCTDFQRAAGSALAKNPNGEVILEGVDQSARLYSESLNPPVSRVSQRVTPLPKAPEP